MLRSGTVSPNISVSAGLHVVSSRLSLASEHSLSVSSRPAALGQSQRSPRPHGARLHRRGAQLDEEGRHHCPLANVRHSYSLAVARVAAHVLGEVVRAHEAARAHVACELLLARVRALVTRELVRAGEGPAALGPLADERFLACNNGESTSDRVRNSVYDGRFRESKSRMSDCVKHKKARRHRILSAVQAADLFSVS